jgi:hypothetical protein
VEKGEISTEGGNVMKRFSLVAVVRFYVVVLSVLMLLGVSSVFAGGPDVLNVPRALTAKWWQWVFETPLDENGNHPLLTADEETWDECGEGQSGKVWFLGGTFNESGQEERNCTIPEKKRILFPLVNATVDTLDPDFNEFFCGITGTSVKALEECVQFIANHVTTVTANVDNKDLVTLYGMDAFRVLSPPFKYDLPENNISGVEGPVAGVRAVSDGFWVLLPPLPAGEHTIILGGTLSFDEDEGDPVTFEFSTQVTYHLTVE